MKPQSKMFKPNTSKHVKVETGCRIHFGLAETAPGQPNRFAGLGLGLVEPGVELEVDFGRASGQPGVVVDAACAGMDCREIETRMGKIVSLAMQGLAVTHLLDSTRINVVCRQHIPLHHGFGGGTQLALAVAAAIEQAFNNGRPGETIPLDAPRLTRLSGRGKRSAIGIASFCHGGLVFDRGLGESAGEGVRSLDCSIGYLPEDWFVVIAIARSTPGLAGDTESMAMQRIAQSENPNREEMLGCAEEICKLVISSTPEFTDFAVALERYLEMAAQLFMPVQGGPYNGEVLERTAALMQQAGLRAVGQSSWGPCIFGFAQSRNKAQEAVDNLKLGGVDARLAKPSKAPSRIKVR